MLIGELAASAGVSIETIRFYQREKLIGVPEKPEFGYRQYPPEYLHQVKLIRELKRLNFQLKEVRQILNAFELNKIDLDSIVATLEKKSEALQKKVQELNEQRLAIATIVHHFRERKLSGRIVPLNTESLEIPEFLNTLLRVAR